jgi:hypothetical protein
MTVAKGACTLAKPRLSGLIRLNSSRFKATKAVVKTMANTSKIDRVRIGAPVKASSYAELAKRAVGE